MAESCPKRELLHLPEEMVSADVALFQLNRSLSVVFRLRKLRFAARIAIQWIYRAKVVNLHDNIWGKCLLIHKLSPIRKQRFVLCFVRFVFGELLAFAN